MKDFYFKVGQTICFQYDIAGRESNVNQNKQSNQLVTESDVIAVAHCI